MMKRDKNAEALALQEALDLFDADWDELTFAINTVLKGRGEPLVSRQAVQAWMHSGIPASRAHILEDATGGAVRRETVRPDLHT